MKQIGFILLIGGIVLMMMDYLSGGFLIIAGIVLMIIALKPEQHGTG
jgi:membrane-bound ClpP family serine protease